METGRGLRARRCLLLPAEPPAAALDRGAPSRQGHDDLRGLPSRADRHPCCPRPAAREGSCILGHLVPSRERHRLRRQRRRAYPAKPKIGIRASAPNELWHIDTTVGGERSSTNGQALFRGAQLKTAAKKKFKRRLADRRSLEPPKIPGSSARAPTRKLMESEDVTRGMILVDNGVALYGVARTRHFSPGCPDRQRGLAQGFR